MCRHRGTISLAARCRLNRRHWRPHRAAPGRPGRHSAGARPVRAAAALCHLSSAAAACCRFSRPPHPGAPAPAASCSNPARVEQAVQQVGQAGAGSGGAPPRGFVANLSSLADVRRLAGEVRQACGPEGLAVLLNNAGVYEERLSKSQVGCFGQLDWQGARMDARGCMLQAEPPSRAARLRPRNAPVASLPCPQDGLELTWAVNVAAPFLLTSLLLDTVRERIVVTSSISAAGSIDFGNTQQVPGWHGRTNAWPNGGVREPFAGPSCAHPAIRTPRIRSRTVAPTFARQERGYSAHAAYSLSKLAEQLFTIELARRLQAAGSPVTCNCLDPGTVNTKMLLAGWGPCGIALKVCRRQAQGCVCGGGRPRALIADRWRGAGRSVHSQPDHADCPRPHLPLSCADFRTPTTSSRRQPTLHWRGKAGFISSAGGKRGRPQSPTTRPPSSGSGPCWRRRRARRGASRGGGRAARRGAIDRLKDRLMQGDWLMRSCPNPPAALHCCIHSLPACCVTSCELDQGWVMGRAVGRGGQPSQRGRRSRELPPDTSCLQNRGWPPPAPNWRPGTAQSPNCSWGDASALAIQRAGDERGGWALQQAAAPHTHVLRLSGASATPSFTPTLGPSPWHRADGRHGGRQRPGGPLGASTARANKAQLAPTHGGLRAQRHQPLIGPGGPPRRGRQPQQRPCRGAREPERPGRGPAPRPQPADPQPAQAQAGRGGQEGAAAQQEPGPAVVGGRRA